MSPMTGEEIVVTRRRIEAMKRKVTPTLVDGQQKVHRCRMRAANERLECQAYQWRGDVRAMAGGCERAVVRPSMDECRELFVQCLWGRHEKLDLQYRRSIEEWTERKRGGGGQQLYVCGFVDR